MTRTVRPALAGAFLAAAAFGALTTTPASARIDDFVGRWVNVDRDTNGITRVEVTRDGWRLVVHVYGQCQPRDCDWGTAEGHVYTSDAGGDRRDATAVTASFNAGFAQKYIVLRVAQDNTLKLESFTNFNDHSHRSDYFLDATLRHPWSGWHGWSGHDDNNWSNGPGGPGGPGDHGDDHWNDGPGHP